MATRLYLTNATPGLWVGAAPAGAWDSSASLVNVQLDGAAAGAAANVAVAETNANTAWDVLLLRAVSHKLPAGAISGTLDIMLAALESALDADLHWHIHAWVTTGNSQTARGTLLADSITATEWPTTAQGVSITGLALTTVTAVAGDRLVVEIGYRATNALTASRTGTLFYGGTGTALTAGDTVTSNPGYIEFSATFVPTDDPAAMATKVSPEVVVQSTVVAARATKVAAEVVTRSSVAAVRATKVSLEAIVLPTFPVRATQVALEVVVKSVTPTLFPQAIVEIGFLSNPGDSNIIWTDVGALTSQVSIRRGRQDELNQIEAGVLTVTLRNEDGRFIPTHAGGLYYPNVLPGKRIRVRATFDGVTVYDLFHGFVENWKTIWPDQWHRTDALVTAADGTKLLANVGVTGSYPSQYSHERVTAILDAIGWAGPSTAVWTLDSSILDTNTYLGPAGDREVGQGASLLLAKVLTDEPGLNHLKAVDLTEQGLMYVDTGGRFTFVGRNELAGTARYTTVQATFGDGDGELPYAEIEVDYDDVRLWNEVIVTREGGAAQKASNAASQTTYFRRTLPRTGLLMTSDGEALSLADWLLLQYKDARLRVSRLVVDGYGDASTGHWPMILGLDIGDRIRVIRRMAWASVTIDQELIIQGVEHTVDRDTRWKVAWNLAPALTGTTSVVGNLFQIDVSQLDVNTTLSY